MENVASLDTKSKKIYRNRSVHSFCGIKILLEATCIVHD